MATTTTKKEVSEEATLFNIWKHVEKIFDTQGSSAAMTELEKITGESDKLFLANQIFTHCL